MANTFSNINADNTGGGSGNPPFVSFFNVVSWIASGSEYHITLLESVHNLGTALQVQVFEESGADYSLVDIETIITVTGDVTITINQIPDNRFDGKLVIVGA